MEKFGEGRLPQEQLTDRNFLGHGGAMAGNLPQDASFRA
jgi:hypothetical protein